MVVKEISEDIWEVTVLSKSMVLRKIEWSECVLRGWGEQYRPSPYTRRNTCPSKLAAALPLPFYHVLLYTSSLRTEFFLHPPCLPLKRVVIVHLRHFTTSLPQRGRSQGHTLQKTISRSHTKRTSVSNPLQLFRKSADPSQRFENKPAKPPDKDQEAVLKSLVVLRILRNLCRILKSREIGEGFVSLPPSAVL